MRLQRTAVLLILLCAGLSAQNIDPVADAITVKSWVGETVTLLPNGPTRSTDKALGDYCYRMASDPKIPVPASYAGRKGKIVAVSPDVEDRLLTIQLENGETITGCGEQGLLFEAEWQKAAALKGTTIWTKGYRGLTKSTAVDDNKYENQLEVGTVTPLTVIEVQPGYTFNQMFLHVSVPGGADAYVGLNGRTAVDSKYHRTRTHGMVHDLSFDFHQEDPHKVFRSIPAATWKQIEAGTIALGMTEEQVKLTCGPSLRQRGVIAIDNNVGVIYQCYRTPEFHLMGGKVVKILQ